MNAFIVFVAILVVFAGALQLQANAQGVEIYCRCDTKNTKPFIDQIKEEFEGQGGIHGRTLIGNECCDCQCKPNDGNWHSIIMVNEPGACSINSPLANIPEIKESTEAIANSTTRHSSNEAEHLKIRIL